MRRNSCLGEALSIVAASSSSGEMLVMTPDIMVMKYGKPSQKLTTMMTSFASVAAESQGMF